MSEASDRRIGAVLIGRNEGERLVRCLDSVLGQIDRAVYVDSGSTDDSVAAARRAGAQVVELDMSVPFTAARARNAGLEALLAQGPLDYVQFVDGDCELRADWTGQAAAFLEATPEAAVACGRRRERFPDASVYNAMCDREWDTPIGQAKACGGDALMRVSALHEVSGFDPGLIAGEEPELCVRLRRAGWQVWRLDAEMTLHDAAMTRFGQWWKRARRGGHAAAEGMAMHGAAPEYHGVAASLRAFAWGLALPLAILGLAVFATPWALALALVYPLQVLRLVRREGMGQPGAWTHAVLLTLIKFPETVGIFEYALGRLFPKPKRLIEYK